MRDNCFHQCLYRIYNRAHSLNAFGLVNGIPKHMTKDNAIQSLEMIIKHAEKAITHLRNNK